LLRKLQKMLGGYFILLHHVQTQCTTRDPLRGLPSPYLTTKGSWIAGSVGLPSGGVQRLSSALWRQYPSFSVSYGISNRQCTTKMTQHTISWPLHLMWLVSHFYQ